MMEKPKWHDAVGAALFVAGIITLGIYGDSLAERLAERCRGGGVVFVPYGMLCVQEVKHP